MTVQITDITEGPVYALGPDPNRTVYPTGIASVEAVGTAQLNASIALSGIASAVALGTAQVNTEVLAAGVTGSGGVGTPTLILAGGMNPAGIAGTSAVGLAQVNATITVSGTASSAAVGIPSASSVVSPTGIASSTAVGSPSAEMIMSPASIPSGVQFGDATIDATDLMYPQSVPSQESFGLATVIRRGWLFRPPVNTYQWRLFKEYEGISLLKENGVWSEVAHPDLERTRTAQIYLGGGRDHFVDDATKAELISEGYTVTEEIIP